MNVGQDPTPGEVLDAIRRQARIPPPPVRVSKKGKRIGRPARLYPELVEKLCALIAQGANIEDASAAVGISRGSYHAWRGRGQEARALVANGQPLPDTEAPYLDFLNKIEEANGIGSVSITQKLRELATGQAVRKVVLQETDDGDVVRIIEYVAPSARALTFFLERRYGWSQKIEHGGPEGGPIPVEVEVSARDLLRKRLGQMDERLGGGQEEAGDGEG